MKGQILKIFILALVSISIFSCEQKSDKIKVGFLMESFSANRWVFDRKFFEEKIKELGAEVITKTSDGNDATQLAQALELIDEGVDIIVIVATNVNSAAAIVREAHKMGVKVIAYDRLILNSEVDYFVGLDAQQIGRLQAQYAINKKPTGNYILLEGDKADLNAINIEIGQKQGLEDKIKSGDINLLYQVFANNWSPDEASYEIEKVIKLTDKQIDVILAANDGTANGAIKALKKHGLGGNVIVTGLDADLSACQRIVNDEQTMTVYTPIKQVAYTSAELAIKVVKNQNLDYEFVTKNNGRIDVPSIILNSIALDKSNLNKIIEDGIHAKEDIYK